MAKLNKFQHNFLLIKGLTEVASALLIIAAIRLNDYLNTGPKIVLTVIAIIMILYGAEDLRSVVNGKF